ncbi:MAG TPA: adenylate/guanylate cyclase domain-containing protein [Jiangellaceae bacterium]
MAVPPTGTVTFLFTDIEGSTALLQRLGEVYGDVQERHCHIIRAAVEAEDGQVVRTEGDSFFVTFTSPTHALRAAIAAQRNLTENAWPADLELRVRMGLHTGHGVLGGGDYIGIDVNRAARIAAAAHGGQVLLSDAARALVQHDLPDTVTLRDLGEHRLKDINHPEHLFDLVVDGLPSDFPPIRSLDVQPNNLPPQLTSFVGRAEEIRQAVWLLGDHRLVTLTGPGGSGKTRLALEVANTLLSRFDDGVFFVDLAPVSDHGQVPSLITQALGIRDQLDRQPVDTLVDRLAAKDVLLVLDNFEHVLPAAWVAERLLGAAPKLRMLVTSRSPLRLYGEHEQAVPPLGLPGPDSRTLEVLSRCEAIVLFSERARAARRGFVLTAENASAVSELCARLDGLPLAIELAASRVKVLTPQAILSRLAAGPDLLTATARNIPQRQRTLRAAIGWSAGLLPEAERRLFARLSVFRGGAGLNAVEAVGNPDGDLGIDTLDALTSLIDNSLIRYIDMPDDEPRYAMLETIRAHARELLVAQEDSASTERRHAEFFMALAREGESHFTSVHQRDWLHRFERDHENVQAALGWAIDVGQPERGMEAAAAMWRFWQQRGFLSVGRSWLERLLPVGEHKTAVVAKAHLAAGGIAYWQREYGAADRHFQEALAISRALADRHGIAEATYNLAFVFAEELAAAKPDWASGQNSLRLLRDALAQFEELDDPAGVAKAKGNIAFYLAVNGDLDSAKLLLEEAITSYRQLGDMFHLADALVGYGQGWQMLGQLEQARAPILEGLGLLDQADNLTGLSGALEALSILESAQGRHERAMRLLGSAQEIRRTIEGGYPMPASSFIGTDPMADARRSIGDAAVDRALAEGRSMTRADAVAYAMELG